MSAIQIVLKILGWLFKAKGASNDLKQKFIELTDQATKDGHITVRVADKMKNHWAEIDEEIKSKEEGVKSEET